MSIPRQLTGLKIIVGALFILMFMMQGQINKLTDRVKELETPRVKITVNNQIQHMQLMTCLFDNRVDKYDYVVLSFILAGGCHGVKWENNTAKNAFGIVMQPTTHAGELGVIASLETD